MTPIHSQATDRAMRGEQMNRTTKIWRLLTIPFDPECEQARWALDRAGIRYREEAYPPYLHLFGTLPYLHRKVPLLISGDCVAGGPAAILRRVDTVVGEQSRLFPASAALRRQIADLEETLEHELGPPSRALARAYLMRYRARATAIFSRGRNIAERVALSAGFSLIAALARDLHVTDEDLVELLGAMEAPLTVVSRQLSPDHPYLVGDRLSAADLMFASLVSPAVLPDALSSPPMSPNEMSTSAADVVARLRATPAGAYALGLYRNERDTRAVRP